MATAVEGLRLWPGQPSIVLYHVPILHHAQSRARMLDHTREVCFRKVGGIAPGAIGHGHGHARKRTLKELANWNGTQKLLKHAHKTLMMGSMPLRLQSCLMFAPGLASYDPGTHLVEVLLLRRIGLLERL